ncbi:hypothetical protein FQN54_006609 [Arachnomyces sp. PD_36]|nr:hypothetical protein FQN54_006609 [Arachnomyces sp. PD_36]
MTRPQMVRADTIDLQDQKSPSAQDHTRHPTGRIAPHQDQSLRNAEQETREEMLQSPRVSADLTGTDNHQDGLGLYDHDDMTEHADSLQDGNAGQYNGRGTIQEDGEFADGESDDGLDDDMMDKISSSPSIDDGGCPIPNTWPIRVDSLSHVPLFHLPFSSHYHPNPSEDHHHGRYPGSDEQASKNNQSSELGYPGVRTYSDLGKRSFDEFVESSSEDERDASAEISDIIEAFFHSTNNFSDFETENPHGTSYPATIESDDEHTEAEPMFNWLARNRDTSDGDDDDFDDGDVSFIPQNGTRFIDSGLGLQDTEDIDFEFVYALHTFVATVEGQANATKGDTMVLLDDSNSYWWLVRVVKDGSIGYLPAEHIETPTERLARLNKHRNIDLSATMLGDNAEKSKNPLKKAMRRRNAKTVTFSAPTYFEPSDVEYSTEEEEAGDEEFFEDEDGITQDSQEDTQADNMTVEPLRLKPRTDAAASAQEADTTEKPASPEKDRTSEELFETQRTLNLTPNVDEIGKVNLRNAAENVSRSRNGVVRNTDSFFKDDSVETKKISLTPNLLRDDSNGTEASGGSAELKGRASLESVEKALSAGDKNKEDKKRKEKKSNMLSGLFKRKDKKNKSNDDEYEEFDRDKVSEESSRSSPQPKTSSESIPEGVKSPKQQVAPQRQTSKLQKAPPPEISPVKAEHPPMQQPMQHSSGSTPSSPIKESAAGPSVRSVRQDPSAPNSQQSVRVISPEASRNDVASPVSPVSPGRTPNGDSLSPVKTTFFNSSISSLDFPKPSDRSPTEPLSKGLPQNESSASQRALQESPVDVSPVTGPNQGPPGLVADTSNSGSPVSPPSSSPVLVDMANDSKDDATPTSTAASFTAPQWSDAHLRTYMEDGQDIRDLLLIVHDTSTCPPPDPNHPVTGNLFKEESKKLAEMSSRLDNMLTSWLDRKAAARSG